MDSWRSFRGKLEHVRAKSSASLLADKADLFCEMDKVLTDFANDLINLIGISGLDMCKPLVKEFTIAHGLTSSP